MRAFRLRPLLPGIDGDGGSSTTSVTRAWAGGSVSVMCTFPRASVQV